ncbi:22722_t:CDS:2 [Cetraspora pellucida]|uniref:22722_t:CDS:1 n=1 Tax=Cetraspora pellucida TaxID=1433469 RepID=A0A9N9FC91_9GLOM|nr:22722_t:CDS:2 [Cetraspora pellucida]
MATKTASPKTRKPKVNNFVLVLEQFLEKHNLMADSTSEQLNKHASKLDVLLSDWMARRCVKVTLARGTDNRHSFSEERIEALLPDKRKEKYTIEERAKYCTKISDAIDIFAYHLDLGLKNNNENKIVTSGSCQSQFRVKLAEGEDSEYGCSKIPSKEDLTDVIVILSMRLAEHDTKMAILGIAQKSPECARELLIWIQNAIKTKKLRDPVFTENEIRNVWPFNEFLKQESYRTTPKKLRDYGSKHASRIHSGKKPTPQHLKLLSRIAMRQESDHLDAGDNYAIGNTESEESNSEPETSDSSKPQIQAFSSF